jgi:predicted MPP superfamily phosphohydrolase
MSLGLRHERIGPAHAPNRLRIAHLSDFHLWWSDRVLRPIEPWLRVWEPDVMALTGDYADTPAGGRIAETWIRRMTAHYAVCWIAGNHDRWWGGGFLRRLENMPHAHAIDRHDAWITGRNGRRFRFTSWARLARTAPAGHEPTVALLHDPARADARKLLDRKRCVLLAGHLHGGQINLWRDRLGRPYPTSLFYRWMPERSVVGGVPIVVSRGLGDTLPLRLGAPRELVIVDFFVDEQATISRLAGESM